MNRILYKTPAFKEFYFSLNARTQRKVDYIFEYIVLNGFIKKSSTDYNKQIEKAIRIMEDYI